jgi:hypothetical protein
LALAREETDGKSITVPSQVDPLMIVSLLFLEATDLLTYLPAHRLILHIATSASRHSALCPLCPSIRLLLRNNEVWSSSAKNRDVVIRRAGAGAFESLPPDTQ